MQVLFNHTLQIRVTWDASTLDTAVYPHPQEPITKWSSAPNNHDTMDEHDHDKPNLSSHNSASNDPNQFFEPAKERFKKFDTILQVPDIQLVPLSIEKMLQIHPVQDNQYDGESLLRFSHQRIPIHDDLKKPHRVK